MKRGGRVIGVLRHCALGLALWFPATVMAAVCATGTVYEDGNGNGRRDAGERGIGAVAVSDGETVVRTDAQGRYALPAAPGGTVFAIKPAGYAFAKRADGLPDFWRHLPDPAPPSLKYGGIRADAIPADCDIALLKAPPTRSGDGLRVLVFGDPQPKSRVDVDYYRRDIVKPLLRAHATGGDTAPGDLGITLGDVVHDDLSLYPAMNAITARLGAPWLHVAGNHDLDFDAAHDADSLRSFRQVYGPDTFAWEEHEAVVIGLDNVLYQPGQRPQYVGGLREDQFAFLHAYLPSVPKDRLLVLAMHIPLFEAAGRDTFRDADRERLFALLRDFPQVLLLTAHQHTQQHVFHDAANGWHGASPLHEYNVGAACGAFWSGVKDAQGIPAATMADGTPNGYASLTVRGGGSYVLRYHAARERDDAGIALHAPRVLRRGAYPAWGVYANVFMGLDDTPVEFRIDDGAWQPMAKVRQPDPALLAENARDDAAPALRGYDRSPEAVPSSHLWRGALPTNLAPGEHRIEVRAQDRWRGELRASAAYRLEEAAP